MSNTTLRRLLDDDSGATTVETAFGIAAITSVLLVAVAAMVSTAMFLRVTDAAGGIARAEARGDSKTAAALKSAVGGSVDIQNHGATITVRVTRKSALIPITGTAVALIEAHGAISEP